MEETKIKDHICKSWSDFREVLETKIYKKGFFVTEEYLYRGQASTSYKLQTSFDRWYQGTKAKRPAVSDQLLRAFSNECEGHMGLDEKFLEDEERMLALAQHNGLPTRLLDWSISPYVAAFFAFTYTFDVDVALEDYVTVWIIDPSSDIWDKDNGAYILSPDKHGNDRMRSQGGRFTHLVGVFDCLEEYVMDIGRPDVLQRILIPTFDIEKAMGDLNAMQINHSRLFLGYDGYAKEAKAKVGIDLKIKSKS
jgi:hypothetical protein